MIVHLRQASVADHGRIAAVVDDWWGGRPLATLLQPLFLEHFASSSLVAEDAAGALVGFPSPDRADEAYVHFVGVHPDHRTSGLGRRLHDTFARQVAALGVRLVRCVTSPVARAMPPGCPPCSPPGSQPRGGARGSCGCDNGSRMCRPGRSSGRRHTSTWSRPMPGARYEATLRRYQRRTDGTVRDSVLFSIIAEEWPRVRSGLRARLAPPPADPG